MMKKLILILTAIMFLVPKCYAATSDNIAILAKKGFFDKPQQISSNPYEEVKRTMFRHVRYANEYNFDGLKSLYSEKYVNADGFNRDVYFDLVKKTWDSYPDIKYRMDIKNITISGNTAAVQVDENAVGTTTNQSGVVHEKGLLQSISSCVYYLEKSNSDWFITSDHIITEKTYLKYGSAKDLDVSLVAPNQIESNSQYTSSLNIQSPKDTLIIASIGQEVITYPQTNAEEIFKKLPDDGILERMFRSNTKNINEYAVASYGITKAELAKGTELKIYVTGIGFVMSRVNVIPKNEYIKVTPDEKTK